MKETLNDKINDWLENARADGLMIGFFRENKLKEDVKQFIKDLKEQVHNHELEKIDKLAGEKLTK